MVQEEKIMEAVASGVSPIQLKKVNIRGCSTHSPIAFYNTLFINSTLLGVMAPELYTPTATLSNQSIPLFKRALVQAKEKMLELKAGRSRIEWMTLKCPLDVLVAPDLSDILNETLPEEWQRSMLCLEVPESILYEDSQKYEDVFFQLKVLGVKTLLSGFGTEKCPIMRLLSFQFNYVMLDASLASYMRDEKTVPVGTGISSLAASTKASVIATGVENTEEASLWYRGGCDFYINTEEATPLLELPPLEELK